VVGEGLATSTGSFEPIRAFGTVIWSAVSDNFCCIWIKVALAIWTMGTVLLVIG